MKTIHFYILLILNANIAFSQVVIPKGTKYLSGNILYLTNSVDNNLKDPNTNNLFKHKNSLGSLETSMGYFIEKNLSLNYGIYSSSSNNINQYNSDNHSGFITTSKSSSTSYDALLGAGIYRIYAIEKTNFAFKLDANLRAGMGRRTQKFDNNPNTSNSLNVYKGEIYVTPQLLNFFAPKWSINTLMVI
jgi:hypothetical protein